MKLKSTVSLLILFGLLLNSVGVFAQQKQGGKVLDNKTSKFDKEKFIATVNKRGGGILDEMNVAGNKEEGRASWLITHAAFA